MSDMKGALEASMLAFSRSLQITEGAFFAKKSDDKEQIRYPVRVEEKGVRGQSSEYGAKNPGLSNPQVVEFAMVPVGMDLLDLDFSLRVLPGAMSPSACGTPAAGALHGKLASAYAEKGGFGVLALRYLTNIANARFAWRNRMMSDDIKVKVTHDGRTVIFDALAFDLSADASLDVLKTNAVEGADFVEAFLKDFETALSENSTVFDVTMTMVVEPGQEVFPSQEYVRDAAKDKTLSRVYAKITARHNGAMIKQASMHSQKIGAALRCIDDWHGDDAHSFVSVNPYAGVQETGDVLRGARENFYAIRMRAGALFDDLENADGPEDISGDTHFFMANLVRGGVFGGEGKKAKAEKAKAEGEDA